MFYSKWIPVDINHKDACMVSKRTIIPISYLDRAINVANNGSDSEFIISSGCIRSKSDADVLWRMSDIANAKYYYDIARSSSLTFSRIKDEYDRTQLLLSNKKFDNQKNPFRLLVEVSTMRTIILLNPNTIKCFVQMVKQTTRLKDITQLFDMALIQEKHPDKLLKGLITGRDDPCCLHYYSSPLNNNGTFMCTSYSYKDLCDMEELLQGSTPDGYSIDSNDEIWNDNSMDNKPLTLTRIRRILNEYHETYNKNHQYYTVCNEFGVPYLFVSMDRNHVVLADTLETVKVNSFVLKKLIGDIPLFNEQCYVESVWNLLKEAERDEC